MLWHFMQIVSLGDNLHEMSMPIFWKILRKNIFKYVPVEIFTQHAKHLGTIWN